MSEIHLERELAGGSKVGDALGVEMSNSVIVDRDLITRDSATADPALSTDMHTSKASPLWFMIIGGVVAVFWMSGVIAFTMGQSGVSGLLALPVTGLASLGFVALGPAMFILLASVLIAELVRFRSTARYIGAMAARFADPAKATRDDARLMANAVQSEINRVNGAVEGALARLGAMEEVLGHHGEAFAKAEVNARERTDVLINDLRREREAVADLAIVLDQKAADIAAAITEQSKMVVAAADIANAHAIDSTKTLEKSAERMTGSAHDAAQGAKVIAAKLDDASGRLSSSTIALGDARKALDSTSAELDQVSERARSNFSASHEDARAMTDLTRQSIEKMQDMARQGADTITAAFDAALKTSHANVQEVQQTTQIATERNARQSKELTQAAEEARSALDAYAEVIAKRLEQANEASFSAASWADKTFERLEAATLTLEGKLAALPETADAQAQDLQDKLRKGLAGLNEAARAAADEAEEIDAGFQARIRQNYELLSDFMLRMGAAADQRGSAVEIPSPFIRQRQNISPVIKPVQTEAETPPNAAVSHDVLTQEAGAASGQEKPGKVKKMGFIEAQIKAQNTRNSTPEVEEPQSREAVPDEASSQAQGWSWKDVLSGMDRNKDAQADNTKAAKRASNVAERSAPDTLDRLVTLFRIHDIDPPALFSTQVYRSLSHARLVGGDQAMINIVLMEAPLQVKALDAAFTEDESLRVIAQDFAIELRQKVADAARNGNKMHLETHFRTGDGPAFLLVEAALS